MTGGGWATLVANGLRRFRAALPAGAPPGATFALSPDSAATLTRDPDALLVDVREKGELDNTGTVRGAVHLPCSELDSKADPASPTHEPGLDGSKRLVLFCVSGRRAALAANRLRAMGYSRVEHVAGGGFDAMKKAGVPVSRR